MKKLILIVCLSLMGSAQANVISVDKKTGRIVVDQWGDDVIVRPKPKKPPKIAEEDKPWIHTK